MQALAEGQMPFGFGPLRVELIRPGEYRGVPARGRQPQEEPGAFGVSSGDHLLTQL